MQPFKNLLSPAVVRAAAQQLQRVHPAFDARRFARQASAGLDDLELKARALHICQALTDTLPRNFDEAADIIERALAPPEPVEAMAGLHGLNQGLRGWVLWPVGEFVAQRGLAQPERALRALHALTQRFTAEWAIRPFIVAHPEKVFRILATWCQDPSAHVRRLVSEGSRPRLPWGLRLQALVQDPSPTLPLLQALQDDSSDYVRKSVANHLNDIAKDHPELVSSWVTTHLPGAAAPRVALLRHASRTLIKSGHPPTMKAWGLGSAFKGTAVLTVAPAQIQLGESVTLSLRLQSTSPRPQPLVLDYAVHHVKANGSTSAKVFKGWKLDLAAGATVDLQKRHAMKPITTRSYHPGWHRVQVQANGQVVADSGLTLLQQPSVA